MIIRPYQKRWSATNTVATTLTLAATLENLDASNTGTTKLNLTGNASANILTGNDAANILNGGTGADTMIGGLGNDIYVVDNIGDTVTENADEGTDTVKSSISYLVGENLENLTFIGTAAINGTGNELDNVITGNTGNNILDGNTGAATMKGGLGNDTYYVDNVGDVVTELADQGTDTVKSSISYTLGANLEKLTLIGTDVINGTGNTLSNVLVGNISDNILNGGGGNDTIYGGLGNDTLTGGVGTDSFVFNTALDAATNLDTITDFTAIDDTIKLENAIFTKLATVGTLSSNFFRASASGEALDSNDYILYNKTTGALFYDADGNGAGAAIQFAQLGVITHPTITSADFVVI